MLLALSVGAANVAVGVGPIKVLIIDGQNNHAWQETTPVLRKILQSTGRFTVDVATSPPQGADMSSFQWRQKPRRGTSVTIVV